MSNELISSKYTFACDPDECDCLIEVTSSDGFGFPSGVVEITCPCGRKPTLLSVEHATIQPTETKGNTMEETFGATVTPMVPENYNANTLVTYKSINDGEATYPTIKVNELEYRLDQVRYTENQLKVNAGKISQIIDNLSADGWYNPNYDKSEVLNDLCEILGHEPKQSVRITATVTVEVDYDIPLEEVEDFDARDFIQENLSIDSWHGDVSVDSFDVCDADVDWS